MPTQTEEEIRSQIRQLVLELAPNPERGADENVLLVEDLEYHSLALLELAFALEDEFDLPPIDEASVQNISSAKDIEDYVLRQMDSKDADATAAARD